MLLSVRISGMRIPAQCSDPYVPRATCEFAQADSSPPTHAISQMCALLARQAAYARGGRAGEPSREVSPCREMSVHRVREQLSQLLGSTLHECESGRSRCPQVMTDLAFNS